MIGEGGGRRDGVHARARTLIHRSRAAGFQFLRSDVATHTHRRPTMEKPHTAATASASPAALTAEKELLLFFPRLRSTPLHPYSTPCLTLNAGADLKTTSNVELLQVFQETSFQCC